jgi:hypothetical protein
MKAYFLENLETILTETAYPPRYLGQASDDTGAFPSSQGDAEIKASGRLPFVWPPLSFPTHEMKFWSVVGFVDQIRMVIVLGLPPVLRAIYASPSLLFNPVALSRISMARVWTMFGMGIDINERPEKEALITPHAAGVVLDLGAGKQKVNRITSR